VTKKLDFQVLSQRQRRNMRIYLKVIHLTKKALQDGDVIRALALVSANHKYPPDLVRDVQGAVTHWICTECGQAMEAPEDGNV